MQRSRRSERRSPTAGCWRSGLQVQRGLEWFLCRIPPGIQSKLSRESRDEMQDGDRSERRPCRFFKEIRPGPGELRLRAGEDTTLNRVPVQGDRRSC